MKAIKYTFGEFRIESLRDNTTPPIECSTPDLLADYWQTQITTSAAYQPDKELLVVVLFNPRMQAIGWHLVSMGTLNETCAAPREVLRPVLIGAGYAFALMHNHPSGDPTPSDADHRFTRRIREASAILNLPLIDHVIIGDGTTRKFSFKESGLI